MGCLILTGAGAEQGAGMLAGVGTSEKAIACVPSFILPLSSLLVGNYVYEMCFRCKTHYLNCHSARFGLALAQITIGVALGSVRV